MGKKIIRCSLCEYCEAHRRKVNTRIEYWCRHPNKKYISDYYKEHKITKAEGFIGFGKPYSDEIPIKASPAWCPQKEK